MQTRDDLDRDVLIDPRAKSRVGFALAGALGLAGLGIAWFLVAADSGDLLTVDDVAAASAGPAIASTMEDFELAAGSAIGPLVQAPGLRAVQANFIEDFLASSIWIESRDSGDSLIVQKVDLNVSEGGWWLVDDQPSSAGERIETTIFVESGDANYVGEPGDTWSTTDQPILSPSFLLQTALNLVGISNDAHVTRADTGQGGTIWTVDQPYEEGTLVMRWVIDDTGVLRVYAGEIVGVGVPGPTEARRPGDAAVVEFEIVESPVPIVSPEVGNPVDVDTFEIPVDLPLR